MKIASRDLASRGIIVAVIHPGWVRTDMGGSNADLSASESVSAMREVFDRLTTADNGKFFNYSGGERPW